MLKQVESFLDKVSSYGTSMGLSSQNFNSVSPSEQKASKINQLSSDKNPNPNLLTENSLSQREHLNDTFSNNNCVKSKESMKKLKSEKVQPFKSSN
jgi:hypothetical protein